MKIEKDKKKGDQMLQQFVTTLQYIKCCNMFGCNVWL